MTLARSEQSAQRFYSMSAQIRLERNAYYDILEATQKGNLDVTVWLEWFLDCLDRAIEGAEDTLSGVLRKARFWEAIKDQQLNERQRKVINQLLDDFEGKLTSSKWAALTKSSPDTALRDITDLVKRAFRSNPGADAARLLVAGWGGGNGSDGPYKYVPFAQFTQRRNSVIGSRIETRFGHVILPWTLLDNTCCVA
jgi:hypothetical protein